MCHARWTKQHAGEPHACSHMDTVRAVVVQVLQPKPAGTLLRNQTVGGPPTHPKAEVHVQPGVARARVRNDFGARAEAQDADFQVRNVPVACGRTQAGGGTTVSQHVPQRRRTSASLGTGGQRNECSSSQGKGACSRQSRAQRVGGRRGSALTLGERRFLEGVALPGVLRSHPLAQPFFRRPAPRSVDGSDGVAADDARHLLVAPQESADRGHVPAVVICAATAVTAAPTHQRGCEFRAELAPWHPLAALSRAGAPPPQCSAGCSQRPRKGNGPGAAKNSKTTARGAVAKSNNKTAPLIDAAAVKTRPWAHGGTPRARTVPFSVVAEKQLLEMAALGLPVVEAADFPVATDLAAVACFRPARQKGLKLCLNGSKMLLHESSGIRCWSAELGGEWVGFEGWEIRRWPLQEQFPRGVPTARPLVERGPCLAFRHEQACHAMHARASEPRARAQTCHLPPPICTRTHTPMHTRAPSFRMPGSGNCHCVAGATHGSRGRAVAARNQPVRAARAAAAN